MSVCQSDVYRLSVNKPVRLWFGPHLTSFFFTFSESFFLEDPELQSKVPLEYLSHKEKYEEAVRKACIIFRKVQELQSQGRGGMDNFR
jgi:hypothetical protein